MYLRHTCLALTCVVTIGSAAVAETADATKVDALYDALSLAQMIDIMREEGLDYGDQIAADLFPDRGSAEWDSYVSIIYDPEAMETAAKSGLAAALAGDDIDTMIAFFTSEPGGTLIEMEVAARRALLDDDVDEASKEAAAMAAADETQRFLLVQDYVAVNDLIETNVVGAMNASYAFYIGLLDGGALGGDFDQEQILSDVWAQEPEIRANTTEWVYAFLMLAYQPISDEDLQAYIAFSKSDAGQQLNAALFDAFDDVFEDASRGLGLASARMMTAQDL